MKYTIPLMLLFIFVFSLGLHLYKLGSNPTILNRDEAALGYNSLLLEKTGKDEWGKSWPLTLESFGDYKLIGYPALLAGLFHIVSPSDFSVRLPSALAGAGISVLLYFFYLRFGSDKKIALTVSFLSCITPVFFFYSRIAFEANVGLFLFLIALYFFLRPNDTKTLLFDIFGFLFCIWAIITYNTPLLLLPFIGLCIPFWRGLGNYKKWAGVTAGIAVIFLYFFITFSTLTSQKQGITIFADETTTIQYGDYRSSFSGINQKLFGNKYIYYAIIISKNYLASFAPYFLVIQGGTHPWHQQPGWGHIYWSEYIVAVGGILVILYQLVLLRKNVFLVVFIKTSFGDTGIGKQAVLLYLLIISLVPAVITVDAPHATRSLFFLILLLVTLGIGLEYISFQKNIQRMAISLTIMVSFFFFCSYLQQYFTQFPLEQHVLLRSGFDQAIDQVDRKFPNQDIAVVDESGYQYILLAWYEKVPPQTFFSTVIKQLPDRIGFRYGERIGRYHFIAKAADRSQDEKIVVEWKDDAWQISTP